MGPAMKAAYDDFIANKMILATPDGIDVGLDDINDMLFEWQKVLVRWAVFTGNAALFESCGLGKTIQQLEWARFVNRHTGGDVLIFAPLAVGSQTVAEGEKIGVMVKQCRSQADVNTGINIANYERLDHFKTERFAGVVLDESSILKSFMGKTKQKLMEAFKNTPYRLCCTATPSPNDHMELLNHSDFLGIMPSNEALSRWFINDTMNFGSYRLKKHAVKDFWRWVSTWAACVTKPSDIGYDDNGFILPELTTYQHEIYTGPHDFSNGELFADTEVLNASNLYRELRETVEERTDAAADIINASDEIWICWCNTNIESTNLKNKINGAVELTGSMPTSRKESILKDFSDSKIRVLVSKPSMCGFGLNWQHVNNVAFVGLSYSFEQRYQAIRRCWRFGQKNAVNDHVFLSHAEKQVFNAVQKKELKQVEMEKQMSTNLLDYQDLKKQRLRLVTSVETEESGGKNWSLICGDACKEIKNLSNESVHFQIFSPPFSSLYIYSDNLADMGNSKNDEEFFDHFDFLIPELKRTLISGRLCAVHCKDLVDYKGRDGMAGIRDFSGEIVRRFESHGWKYHSRVTIWKDPVIEMQRTKAQGLLHKQIKNDSSVSRVGMPDYLLLFRKWPKTGETSGPEPVKRQSGFDSFIGSEPPNSNAYEMVFDEETKSHHLTKIKPGDDIFSIHVWQRYASPVWFDIQQTDVLNCRIARTSEDEKHICPLQLPVIKRAVHLWTNPGDVVLTPFAGVGSELYGAVEMGRKAIGFELKKSYFDYGVKILTELEVRMNHKQISLF